MSLTRNVEFEDCPFLERPALSLGSCALAMQVLNQEKQVAYCASNPSRMDRQGIEGGPDLPEM